MERSRSEREGVCSPLQMVFLQEKGAGVKKGEKEDTSVSLELIKDFMFYKHMLK